MITSSGTVRARLVRSKVMVVAKPLKHVVPSNHFPALPAVQLVSSLLGR